MKKILALTDFSDDAQKAINYGLVLAKQWNAESFTLLHTYEPPVLYQGDPTGGMAPDSTANIMNYTLMAEQAELMQKNSTARLSGLKAELQTIYPQLRIETRAQEGFLGDVANELIENEGIELTVMGIKGKSGLEKIVVGSNAVKAIEGIDSLLLIVPNASKNEFPARIAMASDLELLSNATIQKLEAFLKGSGVNELMVITVNKDATDPVNEEKISALKAQLQQLNPVFHFSEAENIEAGLETFTSDQDVSLLVFVHHERGFFANLFHKSVGKQIAWHTSIPVLRLKD